VARSELLIPESRLRAASRGTTEPPVIQRVYHVNVPISTLTPDEVQAHVERALTRVYRREQLLGV
jgi:hypothetical protein